MTDATVREAILAATAACAPGRSLSPEDVAKALAPEAWHALLSRIRREAIALAREGRIEILRKGKPVDPAAEIRGVIRLRARA